MTAPASPPVAGVDDLWPVGSWLSAALDDPKVCAEMKRDINEWFDGGGHLRALASPVSGDGSLQAEDRPSVPTCALESGEAVIGPVRMVSVRFGDIQVNAPMPGFRHHHILTVASYFGHRHGEQGFADADGNFLTRKEAAEIALASGQIAKLIAGPDLYSEDIW